VGTFNQSSVVSALPEATQRLLLAAAAAAPDDMSLFLGSLSEHALADWVPAEEAGLVRLDATGPQPLLWRDPSTPRALYEAAPFLDRQAAHRVLADALARRADRRAWHLAATTLGPDEQVARALEDAADAARVGGGWAGAARILERSAELSPDSTEAARRYLLAMRAAMYAGDGTWVGRLGARAADLTDDPTLTLEAGLASGWALSRTTRHAEAVTLLTTVAVRAASAGNAGTAWSALAPAAVAAYNSGHRAHREQVAVALEVVTRHVAAHEADAELPAVLAPAVTAPPPFAPLADDDGEPAGDLGPPHATWLAAALDPVGSVKRVDAVLTAMGHPSGLDQVTLNQLGGAAWAVDQTEYAVTALRTFLERQERTALGGVNALVSNTLGAALRDSGAWDEAVVAHTDAVRLAGAPDMEMIRRVADAELAALAALRGDPAAARELAAVTLAGLDTDASRAVGVVARRALGLAALVEGDHERAYDALRLIVDDYGSPLHPHLSLYGTVDLVTVSVRTGRHEEARRVAVAFREAAGHGSARLRALVEHAAALVAAAADSPAGQAEAEGHFSAALADREGATWPFERARIHLDLGAWLRRQRRAAEARPHLVAAQDAFERLGSAPFAQRAVAELRAAGVRASGTYATAASPTPHPERADADGGADALPELTPQQREIVLLAAHGLTNRQIGERLFLSPRTVSSHLYRVFPLLGVTHRAQLRDVLDERR
jgi:DNA-binding CsgD family transcriptional regulator